MDDGDINQQDTHYTSPVNDHDKGRSIHGLHY